MGYLAGQRMYLSGPIEHDTSKLNWRKEPTCVLSERFGIKVFDPFEDPKQQWSAQIIEARDNRDHATIQAIAKDFVRKDLSVVDKSEFVVAYLPYKVPTVGTVHEIINSNNAKKPTLLVTDQNDIGCIPFWYFGFIKLEFMFPNWDTLYAYLAEVDAGKHKENNRWRIVYGLV